MTVNKSSTLHIPDNLDMQPAVTPVAPQPIQLKLGLDVHLRFTMVVVQKGHLTPQPPRKMSHFKLVAQIQRWVP